MHIKGHGIGAYLVAAYMWRHDAGPVRPPQRGATLVAALKKWRTTKASQTVREAHILPDDTIEEIDRIRPVSIDALHNIPGMGCVRVAKYGRGILRILRRHA